MFYLVDKGQFISSKKRKIKFRDSCVFRGKQAFYEYHSMQTETITIGIADQLSSDFFKARSNTYCTPNNPKHRIKKHSFQIKAVAEFDVYKYETS